MPKNEESINLKVDFISPTVNKEKGTVEVKSYIDDKFQNRFLYDSDVDVAFIAKKYKNAKVLDSKFLYALDGKKYVYIYKDGIAKLKEVKTKGIGKEVMIESDIDINEKILFPEEVVKGKKVIPIKKVEGM